MLALGLSLQLSTLIPRTFEGGALTLCNRILVTEDNDDTRELIVRILTLAGYTVDSATNGAEALRKLDRSTDPTLILLDLMMPVMDGWNFLKSSRRGEHRVITISAVYDDTMDALSEAAGVDGTIHKPLFAADILSVAETFCGPPPGSGRGAAAQVP